MVWSRSAAGALVVISLAWATGAAQGLHPRLPERSQGSALIRPGMRRAATTSVAAQAGPAGIEPATPGFGDRCSTN